jgi:hypothetical protein
MSAACLLLQQGFDLNAHLPRKALAGSPEPALLQDPAQTDPFKSECSIPGDLILVEEEVREGIS